MTNIEGVNSNDDDTTSVSLSQQNISTFAIKTTGRQKFGDTRTMPMFSIELPILAEFKR